MRLTITKSVEIARACQLAPACGIEWRLLPASDGLWGLCSLEMAFHTACFFRRASDPEGCARRIAILGEWEGWRVNPHLRAAPQRPPPQSLPAQAQVCVYLPCPEQPGQSSRLSRDSSHPLAIGITHVVACGRWRFRSYRDNPARYPHCPLVPVVPAESYSESYYIAHKRMAMRKEIVDA